MGNDRIVQLEEQVAALAERVAALETEVGLGERPLPPDDVLPGEIDFRLMQRLQNRRDGIFDGNGVGGAIVYAGDFRNEQSSYAWHMERPVPFLADYDAEALATIMAALGHPQRLALVQLLLRGPHDRQQLQEALNISSPGQLYHHLHSLLDAGVIGQRRRGVYAVTPRATIPLLAIMAAAVDISEDYQKQLMEEDE